jgi:rhodanese-related sulfurtransferase
MPEAAGARDRAVVVYCRSGTRSAAAARALRRAGYATVVNLGPMFAWGSHG